MTGSPTKTPVKDIRPRLTVIGVGGAGCNAVNNMIASGLTGVDFVVANTDAQSLAISSAEHRIQLGMNLTEGLGAGSKPEIGQAAAEEALDDIRGRLANSHMVFVAAGMGGGTGTGAAAVIARVAKEIGILTVGVVTRPFLFEGSRRSRIAEDGIAELKSYVDTLIVIPNQNLFRIANDKTTFAEAFVLADQVLYSGVACIVDLIIKEGLINLDFADVRTVMSGMGTAMMGTGEAAGERRAIIAAEEAISNPLLDDVSLKGAKGLLLSITGGRQLTLYEVDEAASRIRQEVDAEANIIVGATFDDSLGDRVRVSIVASGMSRNAPGTGPTSGHADLATQTIEARGPIVASAGRSADDLSERLSAAFGYGRDSEPSPSASTTTGAAPAWRGPGNVTIEERSPQFGSGQPQFGGPALRRPDAARPANFTPASPVEHRRGHRRLPDVSDFPPIAQREYHTRSSRSSSEDVAEEPVRRRATLFQRLAGLVRSGDDSESDAAEYGEPHLTPSPGGYASNSRSTNFAADRSAAGEDREPERGEDYPSIFKRSRR